MALIASFTVTCNNCGTDTGSSRPTEREALQHAEAGDWKVCRLAKDVYYGSAVCPDCQEEQ